MKNSTTIIKVTGIAVLAVVVFGLAFYYGAMLVKTGETEFSRPAPKTFIAFEGLDPKAKIEASFLQKDKTTPLLVANKEFLLPQTIQSGFSVPYEVKATISTPEGNYFDLSWSLNWRGVEYNIVLDGFSPDDEAILVLGEDLAQRVSFDWSGKIEFPVILHQDENKTVCVRILHSGEEYGFCHVITGKVAA